MELLHVYYYLPAAVAVVAALPFAVSRLRLARARHPSLAGHAGLVKRIAKLVPFYGYGSDQWAAVDGAPPQIAAQRRTAFERLETLFATRSPKSTRLSADLEHTVSDLQFTNAYRVPFQFRDQARRLKIAAVAEKTSGRRIKDLDGGWSYDLTGSYGVNLFGYDFYKDCIAAGAERVRALGPVLGPYHPLVADNARRLKAISGLDEVSFHMSGTEAVMQAVRLARFHTGRSHLAQFGGAYHGWWDGVQAGFGNPRAPRDVYTLRDMSDASLEVLATRKDIACVLVNPLQALHPNAGAPGDATLVALRQAPQFDRAAYAVWLAKLRATCTRADIPLVFDEVFVGFRLARGGAQEYFGVRADLVTYGKTLGGGLPVGVVCGTHELMRRYNPDHPSDLCFARGTFNSHPYVMGAMNEFLRRLEEPRWDATYDGLEARWNARAADLNARLTSAELPVRVANMVSIWTVLYTAPSRYHWMLQYYLREQGLTLPWIGTGRFIFSHDFTDEDYGEVAERFVRAAQAMQADGWWWADAELTGRAIRSRIAREVVSEIARRALGRRSAAPAAKRRPEQESA